MPAQAEELVFVAISSQSKLLNKQNNQVNIVHV